MNNEIPIGVLFDTLGAGMIALLDTYLSNERAAYESAGDAFPQELLDYVRGHIQERLLEGQSAINDIEEELEDLAGYINDLLSTIRGKP